MGKSVDIRPAQADDLPWIVALLGELGLPSDGLSMQSAELWIAAIDARPVGCGALESDGTFGLLRSLAVAPEQQGLGIGARLVDTIHDRASRLSLKQVFLLTTTAEGYFPRYGYRRASYDGLPEIVTHSSEFSTCSESGAAVMVRTFTTD